MAGNTQEGPRRGILVTGGAAGIGRATVAKLAQNGYRVAVLDMDEDGAKRSAEDAERLGSPKAIAVACDVRSEDSVERAVYRAAAELGGIYGAVASAGVFLGGLAHELSLERWNAVIDINLTGTFLTAKHVLRHLMETGKPGSLVCVSSPWAHLSTAGGASAYCASKAGISSLVRSMALDYAPHGIRVNTIVPGATETALMWADVKPEDMPSARQRVEANLPMHRLANAEEIAEGIFWLLSPAASYATGSELVVDGGLTSKGCIDV